MKMHRRRGRGNGAILLHALCGFYAVFGSWQRAFIVGRKDRFRRKITCKTCLKIMRKK